MSLLCAYEPCWRKGRDRKRFRNYNLLTAFLPRNPEELLLLKMGLFSSPVKQECLSNPQIPSNTHLHFGIGSAELKLQFDPLLLHYSEVSSPVLEVL